MRLHSGYFLAIGEPTLGTAAGRGPQAKVGAHVLPEQRAVADVASDGRDARPSALHHDHPLRGSVFGCLSREACPETVSREAAFEARRPTGLSHHEIDGAVRQRAADGRYRVARRPFAGASHLAGSTFTQGRSHSAR